MPEKKKAILKSKGKSGGLLVVLGGVASVLHGFGLLPVEHIQDIVAGVITLGGGLGLWGIRDAQEDPK